VPVCMTPVRAAACKFYRQGKCGAQEKCSFSHDLSGAPLCSFFMKNECRYGEHCHYLHGNVCSHCDKPVLHPHNAAQNKEHIAACSSQSSSDKPTDAECGICYESVLGRGHRFGILTGCDHAFCLSCIRSWRGSKGKPDVIRTCPLCRKVSFFVVPSKTFCEGSEKTELIEDYQKALAKINCKYYSIYRDCPFGSKCMYRHDGRCVPQPDAPWRRSKFEEALLNLLEAIDQLQLSEDEISQLARHLYSY